MFQQTSRKITFERVLVMAIATLALIFVSPPKVLAADERDDQGRRIIYKQKNVVDFEDMLLEGDIKNPNEFYFVHRPEEKLGSLVKRRKNFHKEMLRDSLLIR